MTQGGEQTYDKLVSVVNENPASKKLVFAALEAAGTQVDRNVLVARLSELPRVRTCMQTPQTVIGLMVTYGALSETILVDGTPYKGSLDDLQDDETVLEDAEVSYLIETTAMGQRLLEDYAPRNVVSRLFADRPQHAKTFLKVLRFCDAEGGQSMKQIKAYLEQDAEALGVNPETGFPAVYPAYFTTALEEAGAMEWNGVWKLTREGKEYVSLQG